MELLGVPGACPQPRPTLPKKSRQRMGNQTHTEATNAISEHFAAATSRCYWHNPTPLFQKYYPSWTTGPFFLWDISPRLWHGPRWLAHASWTPEAPVRC